MKRFYLLTQSLFLSYVREPMTLMWNLVFPVFLLTVYRFAFGSNPESGPAFMLWVVPGVIAMNILSFGMVGSSSFMTNMRDTGVLWRMRATPVPTSLLFAAFVAVNLLISLMQSALVLLFAVVAFGWPVSLAGLVLSVPMIVLATLASIALGQCVSSLSPKQGVAVAMGQMIFFVQAFLCGLVLPFDMLPAWVQGAAQWMPAYAMGEIVRTPLIAGVLQADIARSLTLAAAYIVIAGIIATRFFRWEAKA